MDGRIDDKGDGVLWKRGGIMKRGLMDGCLPRWESDMGERG